MVSTLKKKNERRISWIINWRNVWFSCILRGGEYDINGFKIGIWTELHENYNEYWSVV